VIIDERPVTSCLSDINSLTAGSKWFAVGGLIMRRRQSQPSLIALVLSKLPALRSAKSAELWNFLSGEAAMTSLQPADTAEKNLCWVVNIDVVCLHLFCNLQTYEGDGTFGSWWWEKWKQRTSKLLHSIHNELIKCWLVNFSFADMFAFVYINHHRNFYF